MKNGPHLIKRDIIYQFTIWGAPVNSRKYLFRNNRFNTFNWVMMRKLASKGLCHHSGRDSFRSDNWRFVLDFYGIPHTGTTPILRIIIERARDWNKNVTQFPVPLIGLGFVQFLAIYPTINLSITHKTH